MHNTPHLKNSKPFTQHCEQTVSDRRSMSQRVAALRQENGEERVSHGAS